MFDHPFIEKLNLKIDENSFRECLLNPELADSVDITQVYPNLKEWVEFRDIKDKFGTKDVSTITNSMMIKYIVCMYDPKSPFRNLDYHTRKMASAVYVGFPIGEDTGVFGIGAQMIMNGRNDVVNLMVVRYCAITRGLEWATYMQYERMFYENILPDKELPIAKKEIDLKIVASYRDMFLAGDKSPDLQQTFYRIASEEDKKLRKLRPEEQEQFFHNKIAMTIKDIEDSYADKEEETE